MLKIDKSIIATIDQRLQIDPVISDQYLLILLPVIGPRNPDQRTLNYKSVDVEQEQKDQKNSTDFSSVSKCEPFPKW